MAGLGKVGVKVFQGQPQQVEQDVNAWLAEQDLSRVANFNYTINVLPDGTISMIYHLMVPPGAGQIAIARATGNQNGKGA